MASSKVSFQSTLPTRGATNKLLNQGVDPKFQSTLPTRGATSPILPRPTTRSGFNPRSPHGERPEAFRVSSLLLGFNPRSPHGERLADILSRQSEEGLQQFQSTLPTRGATLLSY